MTTILIVDDDATIRSMFSRAIQSLGDVEQASGGAEALRMLAAKKYDLVLLDLHMAGTDGFAVLRGVGAAPGPNGETPFYVVSADTSEQARAHALRRRGALFFLTKPVNLAALVTLAGATLQKQSLRSKTRKPPAPEG